MPAPRKFDHLAAWRLYQVVRSYEKVSKAFGVSYSSVVRALDPEIRADHAEAERARRMKLKRAHA